jgi:hypothetical protein
MFRSSAHSIDPRPPGRRAAALLLALLALAAGPAIAQAPPPAPCDAPEHRQFDFWLGDWTVEARGQARGTNRITRLFGDCGLREEYSTLDGRYVGSSFNLYDATRGVWHQTWVDNQGLLLTIEGGLREGRMVLEGELAGADGRPSRQRITWTPNPDGTVRQHWETSSDAGASWTTAFDGLYRRRPAT